VDIEDTTMTTNRINPEMCSEEEAYTYAKREQGFIGSFADWMALDIPARVSYENGANGISTETPE